MSEQAHLQIVPLGLAEANEYVRLLHRHHRPVPGAKFCLGVMLGDTVVGVAIVGRPVSRMLDDGFTLEVNRTCTDGTKNANSALYGACRRATFALGYRKLITYTLPSESAVGSGHVRRVQGWIFASPRQRQPAPRRLEPTQGKLKWEAVR